MANGIPTHRWSAELIQLLVEHEFGVAYHQNHISRLLGRLCLSVWSLNHMRSWT